VLAAAVETFARDGSAGSSVRDIARRARIRVSTLYHYFPSKEALYQEVQARVDAKIREILLEVIARDLDLASTVRETIGALFDFFLTNRAYAQLGYRLALETGASHETEQRAAHRWLGFTEAALKPAEKKNVDLVPFMLSIDALLHWHIVSDGVYRQLLGKGIDDPDVARRARAHVVQVALRTLGLD
jgi:AcrR family transcriptional regulator